MPDEEPSLGRGPAVAGGEPVIVSEQDTVAPSTDTGSERDVIDLLETLLDAEAAERRRLARHLHDDTVQVLSALTIDIERLRRQGRAHAGDLAAVSAALQGANGRVRALLAQLDPGAHAAGGVGEALLAALAADAEARGVTLVIDDRVGHLPPDEARDTVYWIGAEAIRNSIRHARARTIGVAIGEASGVLSIAVSDDGVGFDPARSSGGGCGLRSMHARAARLGGSASVRSDPAGTTVIARVPWTATPDPAR